MPDSWMYFTALKIVLTSEAASLFRLIKKREIVNDPQGLSRFIVIAFCTDAVEELSTRAEIETEVKIMGCLTFENEIKPRILL